MKTKKLNLTNVEIDKAMAILELMENVGMEFQFDKSSKIVTIFASAENFSFDNIIQILEMIPSVEMWD